MKGFKTRGTRADGTVEWDLSGEYAVLRGNTADLTDLTLVFHPEKGGAPFVITSPSCVFDRGTNTGGSEAPIRAETDGFTLLGRGYDVDATNQLLHIHSEVEMTVRRKNAAQTKKDGETISPATESGRNSQ